MGIFRRHKKKPIIRKEEFSEEKIEEIKRKNKELENTEVTFVPKLCPKCGSMMSVRKLGVWGYWCDNCQFWWGTYDPYPIVKHKDKQKKK